MKSAFECFQNAAVCEEKACQVVSESDKTGLLATARHWRTLGEHAKAHEAGKPLPLRFERMTTPSDTRK